MMDSGWYVLACVAVPCAVGAVMFFAFGLWDRRRRRDAPEDGLPMIDYLI